jgi:DTW domain-containing protein YfiP
MRSAVKLVFLMHPHEVKKVKCGTGRLAALSFEDAEIIDGVGFDADPRVEALLSNPSYAPMLLYPGPSSRDLSSGGLTKEDLGGRRLLVFLVDATWPLAKKMLRSSRRLQALPRLMFTPRSRSRWLIKQQPDELCLSTIEAVHELMLALEKAGLDEYERPEQLISAFMAMQEYQLACAADPDKRSYRQRPYKGVAERKRALRGKNARSVFFRDPSGM